MSDDGDASRVEVDGVDFSAGRIKPLVMWPTSRLTTLIASALGYTHYSQFPMPSLDIYACFLTPLSYLVVFDIQARQELFSPQAVRHGFKEGRLLRAFRSSVLGSNSYNQVEYGAKMFHRRQL